MGAARLIDGNENRLFLDPLFRACYPEDMISHYRPISDFSFVAPGDLEIIGTTIDILGVNYYEQHIVQADRKDPERGAIILPPDGPTTAGGNGIHPSVLTALLIPVRAEHTPL